MNTLGTKILIAGVAGVLICMSSNLQAQDRPGRWYLGLEAGLALQQDISVEDNSSPSWFDTSLPPRLAFDPGVRLDLSGGVHLSRSWKAEIELGFLYNSVRSIDGQSLGSEDDGFDYFQTPLMANVIYTVPLRGPLSAQVGAGVGGVYAVLWNGFLGSADSFAFGYQGILGLKYALNDAWDLNLAYKFLGTPEHDLGAGRADGSMSHSILAAITFKF